MARHNVLRTVVLVLLLALAALIAPNVRALYEGIWFYLRDALTYNPTSAHPVDRNGRFGSVYDLVQATNPGRRDYLLQHLIAPNITVTQIPVPNSPIPNLLVRFSEGDTERSGQGQYTLFSAHYDKAYDDANYQGASDNTAADSVLLASVLELARRHYRGSAAFLFVAAEETGVNGSPVFMDYARANGITIRENINFDDLGRGNLAIRPSGSVPGYVFTIPFIGDFAFDGENFHASPPYPPPNPRLTQALLRLQPDAVVLDHFTVLSDSNTFQANGIDTVSISGDGMYYLQLTWDTYYDRVELLDEQNLNRAFDLITRYAATVN